MRVHRLDRFILVASLVYAVLGSLWIVASDRLLSSLLDVEAVTRLSTAKGLLFVLLSSAVFALAMRRVQTLSDSTTLSVEGFNWKRWQGWPGYLLALVLVVAADFTRVLLINALYEQHHLLLVFMPVILVSALLGGRGPGLFCTSLSLLTSIQSMYWGSDAVVDDRTGNLQLLLLGVSGGAVSMMSAALHRAHEHAQRQASATRLTLASISDGVIALNAADRVISMNAAACRIAGIDSAEALGKPLATVLPIECPELIGPQARRSEDIDVEATLPQLNASDRPASGIALNIRSNPLFADDQLLGRVLVLRDETERIQARQALQQSRDLLNSVIEGSSDAIFVKDRDLRYLLCNTNGARMLGTEPDQILGRTDSDLFPPDQARMLREIDTAVMDSGKTQTGEELLSLPGRDEVVFLATKGPLKDERGVIGMFGISRDITVRSLQERALAKSRSLLRIFVEQAPICVAMFDRQMRYLELSKLWRSNYLGEGVEPYGRCHYDLIPDLPERWRELHARGLKGENLHSDLDVWIRENGSRQWLRWAIQPWFGDDDQVGGIIIVADDLTEQMELLEQQRISAVAFEAADAIVITNADGVIEKVNAAYCEVTGYSPEEAIGRKQGDLVQSGRQSPGFYRAMWAELASTGVWRGELWNRRKSGEIYPEFLSITAVRDDKGQVSHYVGVMQDITQRKQAEETITHLAYYDALTDLPNRRLLLDRLERAMKLSERDDLYGALIVIDIDNFKQLNDTLGHHAGDELLITVAKRLSADTRKSDTVARLGGDEFVLLLEGLSLQAERAATKAGDEAMRLLKRLGEPCSVRGRDYATQASAGISLFHGRGSNAEIAMKQADLALHQAQADGRNVLRFFDPAMQTAAEARSRLESQLRIAVEKGHFELHYQLQQGQSGRTVGVEALMRWRHEDGSIVSPVDFIPLAEDTGLIVPMGRAALREACDLLAQWSIDPLTCALTIAVNVSARQFRAADFVSQVEEVLRESGAKPQLLKLELTESLLLDQVETAIAKMHQLRALGIVFSLDDFGTGFSSLSYLKQLPLEQLKIDRSFVSDLLTDANAAVIARSIIALAHSLGLTVVAEGVENDAIWAKLRSDGCDIGQGYLFSKPIPADEVLRRLRESTTEESR